MAEIVKEGRSSHAQANELLVNKLLERSECGWFQAFISALRLAGMNLIHIACLLYLL